MFADPRTIENPDDVEGIVMPYKGRSHREELRDAVQEKVNAAESTTPGENPEGSNASVAGNNSNQSLSPEETTFKKRYGDLRRYTESLKKDFQKEVADLRRQLQDAAQKSIKLPKTKEEVELWMKQYPDVAAIVETIATVKANEASSHALERMKVLEEENLNARIARAEEVMRRYHPDFDDLREDEEFHRWVQSKSKTIQDAVYDNPDDTEALNDIINMYKNAKGKPKSSKNTDLEASRMVKTSGTAEPSVSGQKEMIKESWILRLSSKEYDKNEALIDKASREGRIEYDVSGRR